MAITKAIYTLKGSKEKTIVEVGKKNVCSIRFMGTMLVIRKKFSAENIDTSLFSKLEYYWDGKPRSVQESEAASLL